MYRLPKMRKKPIGARFTVFQKTAAQRHSYSICKILKMIKKEFG